MKNVQRILSTVALVVVLAATSLVSVSAAAQDQNSAVPTKKELVTLLKTANEPPEHLRIAAYYRAEAARLRQSAKEHSELVAIYSGPAARESKRGDAFAQAAGHCQKAATLAEEQAKEADALVALHDDMAKAAKKGEQ